MVNNKKKILFLIPTLMNGGAERVLVNLVNDLDCNKYDVSVKTVMNEGRYIHSLDKHIHYSFIFKRLHRGVRFFFNLFSPSFLYNYYIGNDYDVVISYLEGFTSRIVSGCRNSNTKIITWIHIELTSKTLFSKGFRFYREAVNCYKRFDTIVCVSESVKKEFIQISGINQNIKVLYNTNNTIDIISRKSENVDDVVFSSDTLNICSVAKIEYSKGYDRLAQIHKKLLSMGINNCIYIIGTGSEIDSIKDYLIKNNLQSSFIFLGYKENPYKYMIKCDLYVCSSRREGFSTAVTEALILGLPVVSTNCSGAYELLGYNNEFGIVTDNNEMALLNGILQMTCDKDTLFYYRNKAKERALEFSISKTIKAVESIL